MRLPVLGRARLSALLVAASFLFIDKSAHAASCADYSYTNQQPWVVYGGTILNEGTTYYNPQPFTSSGGILGEVAALPYVVPSSQLLYLDYVTIEPGWGLSILPLLDGTTNGTQLDTYLAGPAVQSPGNSNVGVQRSQNIKAGFFIKSGHSLNIQMNLSGGGESGWQWEWSLHGFLCQAP